jgi:hypothetical protein
VSKDRNCGVASKTEGWIEGAYSNFGEKTRGTLEWNDGRRRQARF